MRTEDIIRPLPVGSTVRCTKHKGHENGHGTGDSIGSYMCNAVLAVLTEHGWLDEDDALPDTSDIEED